MADNRPIVYKEGDRWVYRASSVGRSVRCLLLARQNYTPLAAPAFLEKAAEAGNRYEGIVKQRLREDGYRIGGEQRTVEVPVGETAIIRGHLDAGYITAMDDAVEANPFMLEIKSMSARMFRKWELHGFDGFPHYAAQLSVYMEGTGREALYAIVNRDTDDILIQAYPQQPIPFADIAAKIAEVERLAAAGEPLPKCDGDSGYFCPYDYACDRKDLVFEEVESGTEAILIRLADDYDEIRQLEKEIAARKKEAYEELVTALGDREAVVAGQWRVSYKPVRSSSLNKAALEAFLSRYGLTIDAFRETKTYKRLEVK